MAIARFPVTSSPPPRPDSVPGHGGWPSRILATLGYLVALAALLLVAISGAGPRSAVSGEAGRQAGRLVEIDDVADALILPATPGLAPLDLSP